MANTAQAADGRQALQVGSALPAKITFDDVLLVRDDRGELIELFFT
jgi:hypothetical protein